MQDSLPVVTSMGDLYGFVGLTLILVGWIYEIARAIQSGKPKIPFWFSVLYGSGSLLLLVHSWILNDIAFMILNAGATLIPAINIGLDFRSRPKI